MSRLSKFLKQTASWERHIVQNGVPVLDVYGKPTFAVAKTVKCRKETYTVRGFTGYGQFVNYSTTYYFDETVPVTQGDKIDGQEVQRVVNYNDGAGTLVGYEVQV